MITRDTTHNVPALPEGFGEPVTEVRRKRGRPKGSKTKAKEGEAKKTPYLARFQRAAQRLPSLQDFPRVAQIVQEIKAWSDPALDRLQSHLDHEIGQRLVVNSLHLDGNHFEGQSVRIAETHSRYAGQVGTVEHIFRLRCQVRLHDSAERLVFFFKNELIPFEPESETRTKVASAVVPCGPTDEDSEEDMLEDVG